MAIEGLSLRGVDVARMSGGHARRPYASRAALALMLTLVLAAALMLHPAPARAQAGPQTGIDTMDPRLTDPADVERYRHLAHELRCMVCQNQTLADSEASLAVDLRHQVEAMIVEGKSDDQIKEYLVDRYGEFVLFRPPVQRSTWVLWFGPFGLLGIGAVVWFA
ncbi:MAG: cytochrome c-type biogenesis protein, partial [Gammaproteobacteria bacterium]